MPTCSMLSVAAAHAGVMQGRQIVGPELLGVVAVDANCVYKLYMAAASESSDPKGRVL